MKYKLDLKDKKILYELDVDSRQSNKQIGKKVGLSKEVVNYRIKRMEKRKIIRGYYTVINMSKLGYMLNRFFIKLKNDSPEKEKEIIDYFVKHPKYWWINSIDGFRDLGIGSWEKTILNCKERRNELMENFKNYLGNVEHSIYTGFYIYHREYLMNKKVKETKPFNLISDEIDNYDKTDLKILRLLSDNARIPIKDMSSKLNLSTGTIIQRMKRLKKNGLIVCSRPMIDLGKIGYYWYKIEFTLKDCTKRKEMLSYFAIHPNILYAYESTAEPDIELEMEVESYEEFREVLNDLRTRFKDAIESYRHLLWFKEHKILYFPLD